MTLTNRQSSNNLHLLIFQLKAQINKPLKSDH